MRISKNVASMFVKVDPDTLDMEDINNFIDFVNDFTDNAYYVIDDLVVFRREDVSKILIDLSNENSHLYKEVLSVETPETIFSAANIAGELLRLCGTEDNYIFIDQESDDGHDA